MSRALLALVVGSLAAGVAQAQGPTPVRITMPTKDAGTYHVVTGTWTRSGGSQANLGPDVIYRSDAPSGYFGTGWEGAEGVDEAILPGTSSPAPVGPQDSYTINGFQFEYCSISGGPVTMQFKFYESYVPCDVPDSPSFCLNANAIFCLQGLPTGACWTVTVDLAGGAEFCLRADGGTCAPGYQGHQSGLDHGGWGLTWWTTDGAWAGPVLAGADFNWAVAGDGTCYQNGLTCPAGANGLGARDTFGIGSPLHGCYFTTYQNLNGCGGPIQNPALQFSMLYFTDCNAGPCTPCSDAIICDDALDPSGFIENVTHLTIDTCDVSAGSINVCLLDCRGDYEGQFAYLLIGMGTATLSDPPGAAGDLCLGGAAIGRYVQDAGPITNGVLCTDIWNSATGGGGGGLPNPPGGSLGAGQTWRFQAWHRAGPASPSRFSKGIEVTFN